MDDFSGVFISLLENFDLILKHSKKTAFEFLQLTNLYSLGIPKAEKKNLINLARLYGYRYDGLLDVGEN